MPLQRVVLARKTRSSMVPVQWTDTAPEGLCDVEAAQEMGARWEGDELVVDDYDSFAAIYEYYEKNEYLPDND